MLLGSFRNGFGLFRNILQGPFLFRFIMFIVETVVSGLETRDTKRTDKSFPELRTTIYLTYTCHLLFLLEATGKGSMSTVTKLEFVA